MEKKYNIKAKEVDYATIIKYVMFVVDLSVDKNGEYHEYLRDVAETIAVLAMFTDYNTDKLLGDENTDGINDDVINEVLGIRFGNEWNTLIDSNREKYNLFEDYIAAEIEQAQSAFHPINTTLIAIKNLVAAASNLVGAIDTEKLKDLDLDGIIAALDNGTNNNLSNVTPIM